MKSATCPIAKALRQKEWVSLCQLTRVSLNNFGSWIPDVFFQFVTLNVSRNLLKKSFNPHISKFNKCLRTISANPTSRDFPLAHAIYGREIQNIFVFLFTTATNAETFFYLLEIFKQIGWKGFCAMVHNCHGKRNNPTANEQDSRQKKNPYGKK